MEDMNGIAVAVNILGERIAKLESELHFERLMREQAETRIKQLEGENIGLVKRIKAYAEQMEV